MVLLIHVLFQQANSLFSNFPQYTLFASQILHKPLFSNALGNMQCPQEHLKTIVYAKFGGQTKCIMGNSKIENKICILGMLRGQRSGSNTISYPESSGFLASG